MVTSPVIGDIKSLSVDPFPFEEITIPYLRSRKYLSSLSPLIKYADSSSLTSYKTSYDSDGLNINSLFIMPKGTPPVAGWPAVVFVHGYIPPKQYQTTRNYAQYVDSLARNGIAVLKIDLRGHGSSEGDPGGGYYSSDYVIDTLNAFSALKHYPGIDSDKVGLWGHSMAGNIVLRSFVINPEIKKIVIWAGAVYTYEDMRQFRINDASYRPLPSGAPSQKKRQALTDTYGQFDPNSSFWKQVPATNYLDDVTGSVQIHHALNDSVVSIGYSRNLVSILNQTDIISELFEYRSGGHNLTGSSFTLAIKRTADFIKE